MDDPPKSAAGLLPTISREAIRTLPRVAWRGPVHLIASDEDAAAALVHLARESVLGFDIETRPAFKRGQKYKPSLLQLAGAHAVWLFRLLKLRDLGGVFALLEDEKVIKAGVAVADDLRKLRELRDFAGAGFVELQRYSTALGIRENGVRGLAGCVLGGRVDKGAQMANWAAPHLTPAQVDYAATDAWVCREIYLRLKAIESAPPP